jgi:uncharacterized lipoprotein YajG
MKSFILEGQMKNIIRNFTFALALGLVLSACAFSTANVDLAYKPTAGSKSPLSTVKPLKIALLVEDQRPVAERESIGNKRNGFGSITAQVKSKSDVLTVLSDALRTELSNNGHTVVGKESLYDVLLRVQLKRYWTDTVIHFWDVELVGTINSDFVLGKGDADKAVLSQPGQGSFRESRQLVTESAYESVLNGALSEFIRNFSRDPNVIKALQQVSQSTGPM